MIKMRFAMPYDTPSRRQFLSASASAFAAAPLILMGAAASARLGRARAAARAAQAVRLGGPIFLKSDDPAELAREHRRLGYSAAYCPAARIEEADRIRAIRS